MPTKIDSSSPAALLKTASRLERVIRQKEQEVRSTSEGLKWRKELASLSSSDILTQGRGARKQFWKEAAEVTGMLTMIIPVLAPAAVYSALRIPRGEHGSEDRVQASFRDHPFDVYHFADKLLAQPALAHKELGAAAAAVRAAKLGLESAQAQHAQILQTLEESRETFRPLLGDSGQE